MVIWLGVFLALALFLRVGFSMDASFDDDAGRYLYSGNDPYYHDRTVTHMVETGESLTFDPAINYPNGAYNPNPPLFDWTTALDAGLLSTMGSEDAVGLALNLSVAFWGALTVIPIYLLGADLFNRRAGLWGAFFMAVSAPHIQRSVFGFADHDATTMFFIALAFVFLVKALKSLDNRTHVRKWNDANLRMEGIKASLAANKVALLWAALAGTALSATALTWKGYPYALGVMAFALGIQLLLDHQRHKDSVSLFAVYLIPVFMVTLIPLPWYATVGFLDNTILAGIYVLVGMIIAGAILIPTRDLPSVVVFPALAGAALLSLLVMLLLVPTIGQTIFTGLGYFEQTKLYSTIAEAQRTEIGFVVANMGFFSFFLGLWGLFRAMKLGWKGDQAMLLMASWGIVAIFMALAASRFVFNAAPVFAILAGGMTMVVLGAMGLDEVRQRYRRRYGQGNVVSNGILSMTWKATTGVFLVAVLLVIPNAWFGVD
ncbi:MAG: STT3 domain-containing protein, partial [Thermoplasmatota archaeon]